jgi:hypothetical protein
MADAHGLSAAGRPPTVGAPTHGTASGVEIVSVIAGGGKKQGDYICITARAA